jgi:hypothetical protein
MFGRDRARDTRRQPILPSNPRPAVKGGPTKPFAQPADRRNLIGAPGSTAKSKPARVVPDPVGPSAAPQKPKANPYSMVDVPGVNNFNKFSNTSTKAITTRFEGE